LLSANAEEALADLTVTLASTVDAPWLTVPVVPLGVVPSGTGTPRLYGCVSRDDRPIARLDVYGDPGSETYFQSEAATWHENILVGFGHRVYVVNASTLGCVDIELPCYFQSFSLASNHALAVFGTGILRLDDRGSVVWENSSLAIDGVIIERIQDDEISGSGEWDPPGGWQPFTISLTDGRIRG
jgi:hypothetical protein